MRKRFVSSVAIASVIFFAISAGSSFAAEATKTPSPSSKATSQTNKAGQKPVTSGSTSKPSNIPKQPETESVLGNMEINAAVPPEFEKTILVNFTSTDNENVMARLDKLNGYTYEEDVKPGSYKVDFINVVGENATDYNIDSSEKVIVKKGDTVEFKIQLSLKPSAKPKEGLSSNGEPTKASIERQPTEASIERMLNGTNSSGNQGADMERGVQSPENNALSKSAFVTPTEKPQRQKFTIQPQTLKIVIGITIIALLALMVFLYKQISYKHDYYDC